MNKDVRHILANGSLFFPAFDAGSFRQDVHWAIYKCVASNSVGTIVSRDMSVKAVQMKCDLFDVVRGLNVRSCSTVAMSLTIY
ncbi:Down syndrome cell adhesion molecule-like protein Dscam2 [Pseudolycoriella hygida]|uniref:Down syndrome cell adhesion molecule-like protein Dscam2 n=1 Tax=Pseudolycoriella hygida TaxID=35572 RepID=A0A9Q0S382_9DIPT|nr:Down syndrome cell adhesion molecule-like protein Dscam2 [Pseudolycoriella hygida]